jgi:Flp pilus assembly protein TadB
MKKQKVIIRNEQHYNEDLKAIHELQQGLEQIDNLPVETPNLQWFEQMVLGERHQMKKKFLKDIFLFSVIALLILGGIMMSLYQMPIVFIILQISTTIFIVLYLGMKHSKKVLEHER